MGRDRIRITRPGLLLVDNVLVVVSLHRSMLISTAPHRKNKLLDIRNSLNREGYKKIEVKKNNTIK
jgi:hypothetical protein